MPPRSGRPGTEGVGRITLMENHDGAYHAWREGGVKNRILVHIDAHHDMWWIADSRQLTIANFICLALTDDLVREVFWVVPDGTLESPRGRRAVMRHLRALTAAYPASHRYFRTSTGSISAVVLDRRLTVCPLGLLPRIDEDVLLDIDVDYLVIPRVSYRVTDQHGRLPWCWPGDLIDRLADRHLTTDFATIAYSVAGGYTPLSWKYLGDELRWRLASPGEARPESDGWQAMRRGAEAAARGDLDGAERHHDHARELLPTSAAPAFHLAQVARQQGRLDNAQRLHRDALALDPSYRTPFSSAGFPEYWARRFSVAEREFRGRCALDPQDPWARLGLALLAIRMRRWNEASALLEGILAADPEMVDVHRALGEVRAAQGRPREAIASFERSLTLTLGGHHPIERPIATLDPGGEITDPEHCRVHARLARLYATVGATTEAINGYRIGIAGGFDGTGARGHLAWLYLKRGDWRRALTQAWQMLRVTPRSLLSAVHG